MACIIGEVQAWEETRLVTVDSLVEHIKENFKRERFLVEVCRHEPRQVYTLKECGARIDWKKIKDTEVDYGIH